MLPLAAPLLLLAAALLQGPGRLITQSANAIDIFKLGGRATIDAKRPGNPVVAADFQSTFLAVFQLAKVAAHRELESLDLTSTRISDAGLVHLKSHPRLRRLVLKDTKV